MSETIETTITNNNAPIAAPDPMSEDYESILGNDNASTFNRYAIPPQFDGNSSEEDNQDSETFKEEKAEENEDVNVEEELETGYEPLVEDEFGEFVSSENFGDYYTPDAVGTLRASVERNTLETSESEIKDDTIIKPVPSNTTNEKERVSIAPLDAGKYCTSMQYEILEIICIYKQLLSIIYR